MYHNTDNTWAWGHTHLQELHGQYLGDDNPEVATIHDEVEVDACHSSEEAIAHSCECVLELTSTWGIEPHSIPPLISSGKCKANSNWQNQLANAMELYSLPLAPPSMPSPPPMDVDHPIDSSGG